MTSWRTPFVCRGASACQPWIRLISRRISSFTTHFCSGNIVCRRTLKRHIIRCVEHSCITVWKMTNMNFLLANCCRPDWRAFFADRELIRLLENPWTWHRSLFETWLVTRQLRLLTYSLCDVCVKECFGIVVRHFLAGHCVARASRPNWRMANAKAA